MPVAPLFMRVFMSFENAKQHLQQFGLDNRIMEFTTSSATVAQAASAVGCAEAHITKSLAFVLLKQPILILTAGDAKIDNAKFKAAFGTKATMIPAAELPEKIGHAIGGVCPFGIAKEVKVYLDVCLQRFATVYPACGNAASAVKLTIPELEQCANYETWVDVCKNWQA